MTGDRAARRREKAAWCKRVKRMSDQAAGMWLCEVIRDDSLPRPETVAAVENWFTTLRWGRRAAPLCLLCDAEFIWPNALPEAFVLLAPHQAETPVGGILSGLCPHCSEMSNNEVVAAALQVWRRSLMPGARAVELANIHTQGGRA